MPPAVPMIPATTPPMTRTRTKRWSGIGSAVRVAHQGAARVEGVLEGEVDQTRQVAVVVVLDHLAARGAGRALLAEQRGSFGHAEVQGILRVRRDRVDDVTGRGKPDAASLEVGPLRTGIGVEVEQQATYVLDVGGTFEHRRVAVEEPEAKFFDDERSFVDPEPLGGGGIGRT